MKEVTVAEPTVTIRSAVDDKARQVMESLADSLVSPAGQE
jgi:hypothetical protein